MVNRNSVCFVTITRYKNGSRRTRRSTSLSEITKFAYLQWECFNRAELDVLRVTNVFLSQMKRAGTCKCVFFFFLRFTTESTIARIQTTIYIRTFSIRFMYSTIHIPRFNQSSVYQQVGVRGLSDDYRIFNINPAYLVENRAKLL